MRQSIIDMLAANERRITIVIWVVVAAIWIGASVVLFRALDPLSAAIAVCAMISAFCVVLWFAYCWFLTITAPR